MHQTDTHSHPTSQPHRRTQRNLHRHVGWGPVHRVSLTTSKTSSGFGEYAAWIGCFPKTTLWTKWNKIKTIKCINIWIFNSCAEWLSFFLLIAYTSGPFKIAETFALYFGMPFICRRPANNLWTLPGLPKINTSCLHSYRSCEIQFMRSLYSKGSFIYTSINFTNCKHDCDRKQAAELEFFF